MEDVRQAAARAVDEAAIRALEADYDHAWDAADIDGLITHFAADALIIDPFGGTSSGSAEIARLLGALLEGPGRGSTHAGTILGVHFVTDDVALADGEAVIDGLRTAGEGSPTVVRHRFTDVLVRRDGVWRIAQIRAYAFLDGPRP
jgi:uncharacterized protein (TIGR02246 family)